MLAKSLKESSFFRLLASREASEASARAYTGLLLLTEPDAEEALEFIKGIFPEFTSHDMGHSLRILENLYQVLSDKLLEELSTSEIFCLIMAAMFHDMGMGKPDVTDQVHQREQHHLYAEEPLKLFMEKKMTVVKEWRRLYKCILFVCQAHGMELGSFYGHKDFYTKDTIDGKPLRYGLLGVLLRIGDLLDLDENRTSDFIRKLYATHFHDETSRHHHSRHEHIERFSISPQVIEIIVLAADVEEYHIWDRWLHYLKEDILHANTYLMPRLGNGLNLPELRSEINKTEGASFETEELRFELAEEGQIWNILSQSVYTEEFDFIRELVQNGIDAVLMKVYQDAELELTHPSPRSWGVWDRDGKVVVAYSEMQRLLLIWDTGIGMNPDEVRRFLFRIADSGYHHQRGVRSFPLYTIAKFGIGFISCLSKCEEIMLHTYPAAPKVGCRVRMYSNSTHAFFEKLEPQQVSGTTVCMQLKRNYKIEEVRGYLAETFRYPSMPVEWLNLDQMSQQIEGLNSAKRLKHQLAFASSFQMPQHLFEPDYDYFEAVRDSVFKERREEEKTVDYLSEKLEQCLKRWISQERAGTLRQKLFEQEASMLLREIQPLDRHTDIRQKIGQLLIESKHGSEKEFSNMVSTLLSQIQDCVDGLTIVKQQLSKAANIYIDPRCRLGRAGLTSFLKIDGCMIPFRGDFSAWTIITDKTQGQRYLSGSGLFFVQCTFDDWELGVEWRSVHGFLFQNGELSIQLAKVGEEERNTVETVYGVDLAEALNPAYVGLHDPEDLLKDYLENCSEVYGQQMGGEIVTSLHYLDVKRDQIIQRKKLRIEHMGAYEGWYPNKNIEEEQIDRNFMWKVIYNLYPDGNTEAMAIKEIIRVKNCVCQDGMPLDIDPTGLVPIGMCRVQMNLTGPAQMELNVTRRHVDESRAKLDVWLADVGAHIQRRVAEQMDQTIRAWGLRGELCTLCTEGERSNEYFNIRSREQFSMQCII